MATKEKWTELFEMVTHRKPTPQEFMEGKKADFDLKQIRRIAGMEPVIQAESQNSQAELATPPALTEEIIYDVTDELVPPTQVNSQVSSEDTSIDLFDVVDTPIAEEVTKEKQVELSTSQSDLTVENNLKIEDETKVSQDEVNLIPQVSAEERATWLAAFEKYLGRKPTAQEFQFGKNTSFDLTSIHAILQQEKKQARKKSPVRKVLIAVLVLLLVALGAGFWYGNQYFSRESVAKRYTAALKKGFDSALEYEVWSDTEKPIKKSELNYTDKSRVSRYNRQTDLLTGSRMKKVGQKFLVFPDWKVAVSPVEAQVSSNTKGLAITVNGKKYKTTDSDRFSSKLTRLYPGSYDFKASGKINNQMIEVDYSQELTKNTNVPLDINYLTFKVISNVTDGELYVGNRKVGTLSNGSLNVNKVPVTNKAQVYVQKKFDDKSILKSETASVSDILDGDTIELNSADMLDRDTADDLITAAYEKLSEYEDYHTTPDDLTNVFRGGNKNSMYADVVNVIDTNTVNAKNRSADSISFSDVDVTSVTQTGKNSYLVNFTVVYDFYYSYSSAHKSSGDIEQKMSWSAKVDYVGKTHGDSYYYTDSDYYVITDKASNSSLVSEKNTVE